MAIQVFDRQPNAGGGKPLKKFGRWRAVETGRAKRPRRAASRPVYFAKAAKTMTVAPHLNRLDPSRNRHNYA
jgi:hypothetical protein